MGSHGTGEPGVGPDPAGRAVSEAVDCRWEVFIVRDHNHPTEGFKITWGEWEDHRSEPQTQDINDRGNG